ncbi:MAG TPA: homoserine dehydrogenase [Candidatus Limnocylindrales bacterium]|nr:homoserine dehydrogenase [Candidatus Limnocylindrales bacterium]
MASPTAPFRVALLGVGTVGRATADSLVRDAGRLAEAAGRPIELAVIAARTPARLQGLALPAGTQVLADPHAAVEVPGLDAVVELMGGDSPAGEIVEAALRAGRSVVTANKHLLAARGQALETTARQAGARLRFEAAVGGGTPVLRVCASDLAAVRIECVRGVINGTTNWILDAMERDHLGAGAALAAAQVAGYAETDPSFDVDGIDAADKLVILVRLAFGTWISPAAVARIAVDGPGAGRPGIRGVEATDVAAAEARGHRIRVIAEARRTAAGIVASVVPREIDPDDPLARAHGIGNVVVFEGEPAGTVMVAGPGAGGPATAAAVLADVAALARGEGSTWAGSAAAAVGLLATEAAR